MPEFPTLKDIVVRPEPFDALPWILAAIGIVLISAALAYLFYPKVRSVLGRPSTPRLEDPAKVALAQLRSLQGQDADHIAKHLPTIIRTYLHRQHGALGLYRTADELLGRDLVPPSPRLAPFADLLRQIEALRYGRAGDDPESLVARAIATIEAEPDSAK
ncbi:MAG: hypothetical protein KDN22_16530 [Verrucomicrobiae bacterium]|nr:hypothetical protein [Verrucomicrobiae bacterium]